MKKIITLLLSAIMAFTTLSLFACSNGGTKYSLVSANLGATDISNYYNYNYIEFNEKDGTYVLENKVKSNSIVTKQTGTYTIDANGKITITNNEIPANDFFLCDGETIYLIGDTLTVSGNIAGIGDSEMVFKK